MIEKIIVVLGAFTIFVLGYGAAHAMYVVSKALSGMEKALEEMRE